MGAYKRKFWRFIVIKIIIAGSRDFDNYIYAETKLLSYFKENGIHSTDIEIISGGARGADKIGEKFANRYGVKLTVFPAQWDKYGKSAGYRRNKEMVDIASAAICFWNGKSKGTKHTIDLCKEKGIPVKVVRYE